MIRPLKTLILPAVFLLATSGANAAQVRHRTSARNINPIAERLRQLPQEIEKAMQQGKLPGAVIEVGHNGSIVYRRAIGYRRLVPSRLPMRLDTIFDMASCTKIVATTTAIMQLFQEGKIRLDDPVSEYWPDFAANGKQDITVRELMTHYSGLPPDLDLLEPWHGKEEAYRRAFAIAPIHPAGERFVYSDINFIVLGALVEKLSGMSLDQYALQNVFTPLGLTHTRYLPPKSWIPLIAPTQWEHGAAASGNPASHTFPGDVMLRGVVHDPTSRRMGGVAGHAGVFSTADDVAVFAQNLLDCLAG